MKGLAGLDVAGCQAPTVATVRDQVVNDHHRTPHECIEQAARVVRIDRELASMKARHNGCNHLLVKNETHILQDGGKAPQEAWRAQLPMHHTEPLETCLQLARIDRNAARLDVSEEIE